MLYYLKKYLLTLERKVTHYWQMVGKRHLWNEKVVDLYLRTMKDKIEQLSRR